MPRYNDYHRRQNCIKLLVGMHEIEWQTNFDMAEYAGNEEYDLDPYEIKNKCGTSACMLGHGPLCGIKPIGYDEKNNWWSYAYKFAHEGENGSAYTFLFAGGWKGDINQGMARMYQYLTEGIPKFRMHQEPQSTYPVPTTRQINRLKKELR